MASYYLKKNSKFFYVSYIDEDGKRRAKSSGIRCDAEGAMAKIISYVKELDKLERLASKTSGGMGTFLDWVPGFIESYSSAETRKRYLSAWDHLSFFFKLRGVRNPSQVTYEVIMAYLGFRVDKKMGERFGRRVARRNTALLEIKFLSRIMTEAMRRGYVLANPCGQLGLKRETTRGKREITAAEEKKIWGALAGRPEWMRDCFLVGMKQGCRLSEVQVPLKRIDFENRTIRFRTKGGKWHDAPLHKDVEKLARKALKEGRELLVELPKNASRIWQFFFDSIGLDDITFHCTRVTVVTRLARAGFSEVQSMQYVGHASDVVHAIYRKLKAQDVAQLGDAL